MGFASEYLSGRVLFEPFLVDRPERDLALIVIIPACNEPDIIRTIDSLASCRKPECSVEVIVHVNASTSAGSKELEVNHKTVKILESRKKDNNLPFRLFVFNTGQAGIKGWGAGLARKVVMDEALRRFNDINKPEGLIVSLDADCEVEENYLSVLYKDFYNKPDRSACSIYFEHPFDGTEYEEKQYQAISSYELHLRYYYQALRYTNFPEVYHTVGSAFAVRANIYARSGGMNRQQAGEDFYFIQKTIPMGGYFYLNNTTVIPSPRMSERVPFGTGPAIKGILHSKSKGLETYNINAFLNLRILFGNIDLLYNAGPGCDPVSILPALDSLTLDYLKKENWDSKLNEIHSNTASLKSFRKRFYQWFNMFKVVKYLNYLHKDGALKKTEVTVAAQELLKILDIVPETDSLKDLLRCYRMLERQAI